MDLRMDVEKMDIDDDGDDDDGGRVLLDWMVNVATEGRIEGEEVTGNPHLPDHSLHHHLLEDTIIRRDR